MPSQIAKLTKLAPGHWVASDDVVSIRMRYRRVTGDWVMEIARSDGTWDFLSIHETLADCKYGLTQNCGMVFEE